MVLLYIPLLKDFECIGLVILLLGTGDLLIDLVAYPIFLVYGDDSQLAFDNFITVL